MQNYYQILGLTPQASISEIKIAFRKLAKLYHPDKNPNGREQFTKILKAYEALSNPTLKASYDYKLTYHQHQSFSEVKPTSKNYTFSEKELKRRQYYNDHIKKHAKTYKYQNVEQQIKNNYNEYKYILFATPIAVLLFLMLVTMATPDRKQLNSNINNTINDSTNKTSLYDKKN